MRMGTQRRYFTRHFTDDAQTATWLTTLYGALSAGHASLVPVTLQVNEFPQVDYSPYRRFPPVAFLLKNPP